MQNYPELVLMGVARENVAGKEKEHLILSIDAYLMDFDQIFCFFLLSKCLPAFFFPPLSA